METLIGAVPDGWDTVLLGDVCDLRAGPSGASLHSDVSDASAASGVPVVRPRDMCENRIVGDGTATVEPDVAGRLSRYQLVPGDIVCARTGELGRYALVDTGQGGWLFGTGCMRLRPDEPVVANYLIHYLCHPAARDWVARNATGVTIPSISTATMNTMPVVLPPRTVQVAIGEILGALDMKVAIHAQIAQKVVALRDSLLPLLVTGALPPLDTDGRA